LRGAQPGGALRARAEALEWLMFCNATLHPAYARAFGAMRNFTGEVQEKVAASAVEQINKLWQDVETHLENKTYLCGDKCTVGDILLSVIANWSKNVKGIVIGENAKRLFAQVIARPSFQKALQSEQVEYKAA
ncbi:MAG: glutathione binding-like protein, partial [Pseudomonadota bacterium]